MFFARAEPRLTPREGVIRRPRGFFEHPGVAPRHNPNHFAIRSNGVVRCSCVAMNGTMVELQTGLTATMTGSASFQVLPKIGHGITATAVGDYANFTGLPKALTTSENTITLATIFRFTNTNAVRMLAVTTSSTLNTGFGMGAFNSVPYLILPGQAESSLSGIVPSFISGRSYFMAWSPGTAGPLVITDLTSGRTVTTIVNLTGAIFPTDGKFTIGASLSQSNGQGVGSVAAGALISNSLSQSQLLAWAADPWSFWYP
jgi:hypothetical protein